MKALKLLTQVKTYVPSIYRALAKYACNLYRKCTSQVLKQNSLLSGNFILINTCLSSAFYATGFDLASGFHRVQSMKSRCQVDENSSGRRKWLEEKVKKSSPETGIPLETYTNALKIGTNAHPLDHFFNTCYIPAFNQLRTLFYLRPSLHRMCAVHFPSLHQEMDGVGVLEVLCSYRETYYKVKRRLKESPKKVKTTYWTLIFMKNVFSKIVLHVRLVYGLFTNALLKLYQKGTEKLLESYQIGTKASSLAVDVKATAGEVPNFNGLSVDQASVKRCICIDKAWIMRKTVPINALLTHYQRFMYALSILNLYAKGTLCQTSVFKRLKFLRWVMVWFCNINLSSSLKYFLNRIQRGVMDVVNMSSVYKELKTAKAILLLTLTVFQNFNFSLTVLKNIRTYSLLVLMFHMFSLSAQTPRKDSGADGLIKIQPLKIGDVLENELFDLPLQIIKDSSRIKSSSLREFEGKALLIDFFSTGCKSCLEALPRLDSLQNLYKDRIQIILITSEKADRIKRFRKSNELLNRSSLPIVAADSKMKQYFPHHYISHFVWIDSSLIIRAITGSDQVQSFTMRSFLNGNVEAWPYKSESTIFFSAPLVELPKETGQLPNNRKRSLLYAMITGYTEGIGPYEASTADTVQAIKRLSFRNRTILELYLIATDRLYKLRPEQINLELDNQNEVDLSSADLSIMTKDEWYRRYGYCYERTVPLGMPAQVWRKVMLNDLNQFFGLQGNLGMQNGMEIFSLRKQFAVQEK